MANPAAVLAVKGVYLDEWESHGFHPTDHRPFPSMRCTGVVRNGVRTGEQCRQPAYYGASVCLQHGANLPSVRGKADELVLQARLGLVDGALVAVETITDLMQNAQSEAVRLKAATEVLDRAGVRGGTEITVTDGPTSDPATLLSERLQNLRDKSAATVIEHDTEEPAYNGKEPEAAAAAQPALEG